MSNLISVVVTYRHALTHSYFICYCTTRYLYAHVCRQASGDIMCEAAKTENGTLGHRVVDPNGFKLILLNCTVRE